MKTASISYLIRTPSSISSVTLTADPPSPSGVNTLITLTASVTGGYRVEYQFQVYNGVQWVELRGYAADNTCPWTPAAPGQYTLQTMAREVGTTTPLTATSNYTVTAMPISGVTLVVDPASPQAVGTSTTLTAIVTGGNQVEYAFLVYDGAQWTTLRGYTAGRTCPWMPTKPGQYSLKVQAREVGTTSVKEATSSFIVTVPPITGLTLTTNPASPQAVGTGITLTATVMGGNQVRYAFLVSDGVRWAALRGYATDNTCPWTPGTPGQYTLKVQVREVGITTVKEATTSFTATVPPITGVTLAADPASPQVMGTSITLTATVTGGECIEYAFQVFDGAQWVALREYAADNTCLWTPAVPGQYPLRVMVREVGTMMPLVAVNNYTVTAVPITGLTLAVDPVPPQVLGTLITLAATVTGGYQVEYRFQVYDGVQWVELRGYAEDNTCAWTPAVPGENILKVEAREVGTTMVTEVTGSFTVTIPPITGVALTPYPASPQEVGANIILTTTVNGGFAVEYRFEINDGTTWTSLQPYGTVRSATWTPQREGNYTLRVWAREAGSTDEYTAEATLPYIVEIAHTPVGIPHEIGQPEEGAGTANYDWFRYGTENQFGIAFRATKTSVMQAVTLIWKTTGGYADGNRGSYIFEIQSNSQDNHPSGTVLASSAIFPFSWIDSLGTHWYPDGGITIPLNAALTSGVLYHLVVRNVDFDPATNYASCNTLMSRVYPWDTVADLNGPNYRTEIFYPTDPTTPNIPARWYPWTSKDNIYNRPQPTTGPPDINLQNGGHAAMAITWNDGTVTGSMHYSSTCPDTVYGADTLIYGSKELGEKIVWQQPNSVITKISFALGKLTSSAPPAALTYTLATADGTQILVQGQVMAEQINTDMGTKWVNGQYVPDPTFGYVQAVISVDLSANPITLINGQSYTFRLSSQESTYDPVTGLGACYYHNIQYGDTNMEVWPTVNWGGYESCLTRTEDGITWTEMPEADMTLSLLGYENMP
ncbi:MAG: triple tyrosine motif-containing protein [Armatimonadota bacterium]